jgi:hypothetical protein
MRPIDFPNVERGQSRSKQDSAIKSVNPVTMPPMPKISRNITKTV